MSCVIQTTNDQALLVVKDAKRDDTGPYTVVLKNPSGSAEATVKVNVIGTTMLYEYEYVYCDIAARRLDWDNQKCNKII